MYALNEVLRIKPSRPVPAPSSSAQTLERLEGLNRPDLSPCSCFKRVCASRTLGIHEVERGDYMYHTFLARHLHLYRQPLSSIL